MLLSWRAHVFMCTVLAVLAGSWPTLAHGGHHPSHQHRHHHQGACAEPTDLQQRLDELGHVTGRVHDTFFMLPFLREAADNQTQRHSGAFLTQPPKQTRVLSGSAQCPASEDPAFHGEPCPTYTVVNYDVNRFPKMLMETRCRRCTRCRGLRTIKRQEGGYLIPSCESVYHHVRVLRRTGCREGVHQYSPTWEKLHVACACKLQPLA